MNLFIEYFYKEKNIARHGELLACLYENVHNDKIKRIFMFVGEDTECPIKSDKVEYIRSAVRPTYSDLFREANVRCPKEICIVANADIIFDNSIEILEHTNLDNVFIALSRWDIELDGTSRMLNNSAAQDAWIFKSPIKVPKTDFSLGFRGSDNRLAYLMNELGYEIRNPTGQIITRHLHLSNFRGKVTSPTVQGPYLCVKPNDDINKRPEFTYLKGFDDKGQPIYL